MTDKLRSVEEFVHSLIYAKAGNAEDERKERERIAAADRLALTRAVIAECAMDLFGKDKEWVANLDPAAVLKKVTEATDGP